MYRDINTRIGKVNSEIEHLARLKEKNIKRNKEIDVRLELLGKRRNKLQSIRNNPVKNEELMQKELIRLMRDRNLSFEDLIQKAENLNGEE